MALSTGLSSVLTTWLPLPPEKVIQERKGGRSYSAFDGQPHTLPFPQHAVGTWMTLVQCEKGPEGPEHWEAEVNGMPS